MCGLLKTLINCDQILTKMRALFKCAPHLKISKQAVLCMRNRMFGILWFPEKSCFGCHTCVLQFVLVQVSIKGLVPRNVGQPTTHQDKPVSFGLLTYIVN